MAIIKNRLIKNFSTIPNQLIIDTTISTGARILYCYIVSKPDNWEIFNAEIAKTLQIGSEKTIAKYWKELINTGWISREREINEKKQYNGGFVYTIYEIKNIDNSLNGNNCHLGGNSLNGSYYQLEETTYYNNKESINKKELKEKLYKKENLIKEDKNVDLEEQTIFSYDKFTEIYKIYNPYSKITPKENSKSFKLVKAVVEEVGNYEEVKENLLHYLQYHKENKDWYYKKAFDGYFKATTHYGEDWSKKITAENDKGLSKEEILDKNSKLLANLETGELEFKDVKEMLEKLSNDGSVADNLMNMAKSMMLVIDKAVYSNKQLEIITSILLKYKRGF
jgi:hypothetical protein